MTGEHLAGLRQPNRPLAPVEERHTGLALQRRHMHAHPRLGTVNGLGGGTETSRVDDSEE